MTTPIQCSLSDTSAVEALHPRLAQAVAFLKRPDLAQLAPGKYPIDGDKIFASVQDCTLKPIGAQQRVEFHHRYIDVQMPISGEETFGLPPMPTAPVTFDDAKDVALFDAVCPLKTVKPGEFLILGPNVPHAPCLTKGQPAVLRKVVVKVEY